MTFQFNVASDPILGGDIGMGVYEDTVNLFAAELEYAADGKVYCRIYGETGETVYSGEVTLENGKAVIVANAVEEDELILDKEFYIEVV